MQAKEDLLKKLTDSLKSYSSTEASAERGDLSQFLIPLLQRKPHYPYYWQDLAVQLIPEISDLLNGDLGIEAVKLCFSMEYPEKAILKLLITRLESQNIDTFPLLLPHLKSLGHNDYGIKKLLKIFHESGGNLYALDGTGKLLISELLYYSEGNYIKQYSVLRVLTCLIQELNFDATKVIGNKIALERFSLECLKNDDVLGLLAASIKDASPLLRKRFFKFCLDHKLGSGDFIKAVLEQNLNESDRIFQEIELNFLNSKRHKQQNSSKENFDARMLAHRYSLNGTVPTLFSEFRDAYGLLTLTGSSHTDTACEITSSLMNFIEEFSSEMSEKDLAIYRKAYHLMHKAFRYRIIADNYEFEKLRQNALVTLHHQCLNDIALIHTGYRLHAVSIIVSKGTVLYRCNKGGCNFGNDVIERYKITKKEGLTLEVIKKLLIEDGSEVNKPFIHGEIHRLLGLELIEVTKGKLQTVGNCSWASKKTGFRALLQHLSIEDSTLEQELSKSSLEYATQLFKAWVQFDRHSALKQYINRHGNTLTAPYLYRRILCTHFDPDKKKDSELGMKLMQTLRSLPGSDPETGKGTVGMMEFLITHLILGLKKETEKQAKFARFMQELGINLEKIHEKEFLERAPQIVQMFAAVMENDAKKVSELFMQGANPKEFVYVGWTPLHIATANNNNEIIDLCLGFEPNWTKTRNSVKRTPLYYVNRVESAKKIVAAGGQVNDAVDEFESVINEAVTRGNLPLVQYFVENGAKFNDETLHCAARSGCVKTVEYLLSVDSKLLKSKDYDYYLPIHTAAELGHLEIVKLLLEKGSPASPPDVNGNTPIHLAARFDKPVVIEWLAKLPYCTLIARNHQNRTLLDLSEPSCKDKGKDKDRDKDKDKGKAETEVAGSSYDIDIPMSESTGKTLSWQQEIHSAIKKQVKDCSHYEGGFVSDPRMVSLKTPEQSLFGTVRDGDLEAFRGCLAKFPTLNINAIPKPFFHDVLHEAVTRRHNDIFDILIIIPNINVNSRNGIGETPLHCAVAANNMHALKALIDHPKTEINAVDDMGYTALHCAATLGCAQSITLLLQHAELDSTIVTNMGETADAIVKVLYFDYEAAEKLKRVIQQHQVKCSPISKELSVGTFSLTIPKKFT